MAKRDEITAFLNEYLAIGEFHDSSDNGMQIEGSENVDVIAFGVSSDLKLFEGAVKNKAQMVIAHHGIYWGKSRMLTGYFKKRIKTLLDNNITLLAYHLPLDAHPEVGNNIGLARILNPAKIEPFGDYNNKPIGFKAVFKKPLMLAEAVKMLEKGVGTKAGVVGQPARKIKTLAIISGGASRFIDVAARENADAYLTGEPSEDAWSVSVETGCALISLGHYDSEKLGVQSLAKLLKEKFKVKTVFINTNNPY